MCGKASIDWQHKAFIKVVIPIFASGSLVCTGAKKEQDVYDAVHKLHGSLEEQNLTFYE